MSKAGIFYFVSLYIFFPLYFLLVLSSWSHSALALSCDQRLQLPSASPFPVTLCLCFNNHFLHLSLQGKESATPTLNRGQGTHYLCGFLLFQYLFVNVSFVKVSLNSPFLVCQFFSKTQGLFHVLCPCQTAISSVLSFQRVEVR